MLKSYGWVGGLCDYCVSPSPFGFDFGTLDLDFGLGLDNYNNNNNSSFYYRSDRIKQTMVHWYKATNLFENLFLFLLISV